MGSFDFVDISLRDAISAGLVVGPRISACGYQAVPTRGHVDLPGISLAGFNNVVDSVDEARKATRYLIGMGVDHIKTSASRGRRVKGRKMFFSPELGLDVMRAICEEAHSAGITVAAHSQGGDGEMWAVQAGVDSLEHGPRRAIGGPECGADAVLVVSRNMGVSDHGQAFGDGIPGRHGPS